MVYLDRASRKNKQINEKDGTDHVINEDDDKNLHNIDNDVISDGASDDTSSNSQESNKSWWNYSYESKLKLDGFDIYVEIYCHFLAFTYSFNISQSSATDESNQVITKR
jgi:hypothetical protein